MNLSTRKLLYLVMGSGGFLIAFPAALGFIASGIALILGETMSMDLFLVTLGGFIGLGTATYTWLSLPIYKIKIRVWLTIGITIGCASSLAALILVWVWPPAFFNGSFVEIVIGIYLYMVPFAVGLMLICEIWLTMGAKTLTGHKT